MNNLEITNTFIYVKCSDQQAKIMNAIWVKSKNAWRVPNTLGALRELHKFGFDVSEYGKNKSSFREKLLSLKTRNDSLVHTPELASLRPYQRVDIDFLAHLSHSAIFNEQRTGEQL